MWPTAKMAMFDMLEQTKSLSVQQVVDKLRPLGFFGNNTEESVHKFANFLVKLEQSKKLDFNQQVRSRALDKEERERADEAELDNFILGVLFEDSTDEVMDMESEHIAMSRTDMFEVTKGSMRRNKSNSFKSK
jgi:hypothetical protein